MGIISLDFSFLTIDLNFRYSSKIVSSREAESMVSAEELFRFKNAFDRMGSNKVKGERVIDKITFKMLMLSDFSDMVSLLFHLIRILKKKPNQ